MKHASSRENEGVNFALFIARNGAKISASGQRRKMGLFNPESREEQAHFVYHENVRFQEILRENKKEKSISATITNIGMDISLRYQ